MIPAPGLWSRGQATVCTLVLQEGGYAIGQQPIRVKPQVLQKSQQAK